MEWIHKGKEFDPYGRLVSVSTLLERIKPVDPHYILKCRSEELAARLVLREQPRLEQEVFLVRFINTF
jgi:hypothetical protein